MRTRPRLYRWSRQEYERLAELGAFEGKPVELIGGRIVAMTPKGPRHAALTKLIEQALEAAFAGQDVHVRAQDPLALSDDDEPEPDLAVVTGGPRDYLAAHPRPDQTLLIVEIAETTQAYDLGRKADLYAASGIADYWAIDAPARVLVTLRDPRPPPDSATGWRYAETRRLGQEESIAPLAVSGRAIPVAALLP